MAIRSHILSWLKAATVGCCFLLVAFKAQSQSLKREGQILTSLNPVDYDIVAQKYNPLTLMVVPKGAEQFKNSLKILYVSNSKKLTSKTLHLYDSFEISDVTGYGMSSIAVLTCNPEKFPIQIYKQEKGKYILYKKHLLPPEQSYYDACFFADTHTLLLAGTYDYLHGDGMYDHFRLARLNIETGKIEATQEVESGNGILFSYYPRQFVAVSAKYIVMIDPLQAKLFVYDHHLQQQASQELPFLDFKKSRQRMDSLCSTDTLKKYKQAKARISFLNKHQLAKCHRIEKIFFTDSNIIAISVIPDSNVENARQLYTYNIDSKKLLQQETIVYKGDIDSNEYELRYTGYHHFINRKSVSLGFAGDLENPETGKYTLNIFEASDYNPAATLSINNIIAANLCNARGAVLTKDSLAKYTHVVFADQYFCARCVHTTADKRILTILTEGYKSSNMSRVSTKNYYKKSNNIEVAFLQNPSVYSTDKNTNNKIFEIVQVQDK